MDRSGLSTSSESPPPSLRACVLANPEDSRRVRLSRRRVGAWGVLISTRRGCYDLAIEGVIGGNWHFRAMGQQTAGQLSQTEAAVRRARVAAHAHRPTCASSIPPRPERDSSQRRFHSHQPCYFSRIYPPRSPPPCPSDPRCRLSSRSARATTTRTTALRAQSPARSAAASSAQLSRQPSPHMRVSPGLHCRPSRGRDPVAKTAT
jgi:hypothetical protein